MHDKSRTIILLAFFCCLFFILLIRLVDLQLLHHSFYQEKSQEQRTRLIKLAAHRGDIFDRSGNIFSTSIDSFSVYKYKHGWLARKLSQQKANELKAKDEKNIAILKEKKRIYPKKKLAAQALGFVGVDNQGLSGLELAYDEYLKGKEGRVITEGDPRGVELYGAYRELEPGSNGMNITLTLDENIQYVAEKELIKQIKKFKALSGSCIVMDAKTGEILALASKPDFDPNHYRQYSRKSWHPTFLDPFEPGSTFKVITVAAALQEDVISLETMLKAQDTIKVGGRVIGNAHEIDWPGKKITISKMLEESINTGVVQIGLRLGPEKLYKRIKAFNFGQSTGFGLYGESRGILRYWENWYKPDIAMITFGQSIATTPMQLLQAFSAFTNDGVMIKPFLVKKIESPDGSFVKVFTRQRNGRAVSAKVAHQVKGLLRNVVTKGTGRPAAIKGFGVCGKTGTAQKAKPNGRGYMKGHYVASFLGFAPMDDPKIICLVTIDDPKDKYWGSTVSAPVFKKVVEFSLRYLNVKPDML